MLLLIGWDSRLRLMQEQTVHVRHGDERGLEYAGCYGEIVSDDLFGEHLTTTGCLRTGCMFCLFGVQLEKPNRFQLMKSAYPTQYRYCMDYLGIGELLDYIGVPKE